MMKANKLSLKELTYLKKRVKPRVTFFQFCDGCDGWTTLGSWENVFHPSSHLTPQLISSMLTFLPPAGILISFDLSVVLKLEAVFKNFHFMMKTARTWCWKAIKFYQKIIKYRYPAIRSYPYIRGLFDHRITEYWCNIIGSFPFRPRVKGKL